MPVPTAITDLSQTASSNYPSGSDSPSDLDNVQRAHASFIALLRDGKGKSTPIILASASTTDIGGQNSEFVEISGTTTITSLGTNYNGPRFLRFAGALTLTHNATSLILPGGANITTAAGDVAIAVPKSTADGWYVIFQRASDGSSVNGFRLTLTSGTPVTTTDVTAASTIYCCPYRGNQIALYSGSSWALRSSAQFSIALSGLTSGRPYDVYCYDNSGTPALEVLAWTNDTTRATALTYLDGVLVKNGDSTRRYLGTFYTTGAASTEDSAANRYLWNYYNRVDRNMISAAETTNTWNYTTATFRQANANTANQLNFVIGVAEDSVDAEAFVISRNTNTDVLMAVGIGLDSTTANASGVRTSFTRTALGNVPSGQTASYKGNPAAGRHYLAWLEYSEAVGTTTWLGDNNAPTIFQSGIIGGLIA